jgi:Domain of unknown function (DUF1906)
MIITQAYVGAKCFDTREPLTPELLAAARAAGFQCAIRYLDQITPEDRDAIFGAGMACMLVSTCRGPGWAPSGPQGLADGQRHLAEATAVGMQASTIFYDVEGVGPDPTGLIAQISNWAAVFIKPGLYYGAGAVLTGLEMYKLPVTAYWRGQSRPIDRFGQLQEPSCGNMMVQLYPATAIAGVPVDVSFIQKDFVGRLPYWAVSSWTA